MVFYFSNNSMAVIPGQNTPTPPKTLAEALSLQTAQLIVGQLGIAGFMFAVKRSLASEDKVEITRNWVQSGAFVNDHTVIPPSRITLQGRISENEKRLNGLLELATNVAKGVGIVSEFLPTLTNVSKSLYKNALSNNQGINASSILSSVYTNSFNIYGAVQQSLALLNNQGQVYAFFNALRSSRTFVSVITPWNFYQCMLITNIRTTSTQASNTWCDMEIDLEEYRSYQFAQSIVPYTPVNTAQGLQNSISSVVNKGNTKGIKNPRQSFLSYLTS